MPLLPCYHRWKRCRESNERRRLRCSHWMSSRIDWCFGFSECSNLSNAATVANLAKNCGTKIVFIILSSFSFISFFKNQNKVLIRIRMKCLTTKSWIHPAHSLLRQFYFLSLNCARDSPIRCQPQIDSCNSKHVWKMKICIILSLFPFFLNQTGFNFLLCFVTYIVLHPIGRLGPSPSCSDG